MNRFVCVHGHFYQPPREDPWLKKIERQDSAAPYHDWNERITAECYAANAQSKLLDDEDNVRGIVNNYSKINFNFGPTLLSWMKESAPDVYASILAADKESVRRFSGHGSAIAQAYNHMIMPLANAHDKQTQVVWGIKDFRFRFHRDPEGMWLPETAVNNETLEVLAREGIKYTILSPNQAGRVRAIGNGDWRKMDTEKLATHFPYLCCLPSGKEIAVFFYNGRLANEVAFSALLESRKGFTQFILNGFDKDNDQTQLVHLANDGETYGHHHRSGHQALTYMLDYVEAHQAARLTNYGEFLEKYPPVHEVRIKEDSSWSCYHGVERWRAHCGCSLSFKKDWNQHWRRCLRESLDWLRDALILCYEKEMALRTPDPWKLRDDYIGIVLDRSPESLLKFWQGHDLSGCKKEEKVNMIHLLEMQRYAMLMYTSCGWFFDDISGIEAVQNLRYAARAIELAKEACSVGLEGEFVNRMESAKSNIPEMQNGKKVFELLVKRNIKREEAF